MTGNSNTGTGYVDPMAQFLADVGSEAGRQGAEEYKQTVGRVARILRRLQRLLTSNPNSELIDAIEAFAEGKRLDADGCARIITATLILADEDTYKEGLSRSVKSFRAAQAATADDQGPKYLKAYNERGDMVDGANSSDTVQVQRLLNEGYLEVKENGVVVELRKPRSVSPAAPATPAPSGPINPRESVPVYRDKLVGRGQKPNGTEVVSRGLRDRTLIPHYDEDNAVDYFVRKS